MKKLLTLTLCAAAVLGRADVLVLETTQVGGFFADGAPMNDFAHQNYFVGYGTTPGFPRTSERRSFFHFDVPTIDGEILSAKISLKLLVSTSLVFGLGPGMPPDPIPSDPFETFQLGVTPLDAAYIKSPFLTAPEWGAIFDTFDDIPVAPIKTFFKDDPLPLPATIEIHLDMFGLMAIGLSEGSDLVLTGWMPSWSFDPRIGPGGAPLEGSELIFGFSDVTGPSGALVPKPTLTIEYAPVPEPATFAVLGLGCLAFVRRRKR